VFSFVPILNCDDFLVNELPGTGETCIKVFSKLFTVMDPKGLPSSSQSPPPISMDTVQSQFSTISSCKKKILLTSCFEQMTHYVKTITLSNISCVVKILFCLLSLTQIKHCSPSVKRKEFSLPQILRARKCLERSVTTYQFTDVGKSGPMCFQITVNKLHIKHDLDTVRIKRSLNCRQLLLKLGTVNYWGKV
jgi:hypothetical protein